MKWESWSPRKAFFWWCVLIFVVFWIPILVLTSTADGATTYQGKSAKWWAKHAVQARKDANARAQTIRSLRLTLRHDVSIQEAVLLASTVYPQLSTDRAWCLINHESRGFIYARNTTPVGSEHATGIFQFLPSTFRSTPFGSFYIYSPLAQALAAGWMHAHGRGGEWATC